MKMQNDSLYPISSINYTDSGTSKYPWLLVKGSGSCNRPEKICWSAGGLILHEAILLVELDRCAIRTYRFQYNLLVSSFLVLIEVRRKELDESERAIV